MSEDTLKPLGVNVPFYLDSKGYRDTQTKKILRTANEMAKLRGTKIIHLDFVMVADGTIRENQMGGLIVWQTRRAMKRKRLGLTESQKKTTLPAVQPRKPRRRLAG